MDSPSDISQTKFHIKEQLKMEPTKAERKFFKAEQPAVTQFLKEERIEERKTKQAKTKDLLCMGVSKKLASGPNPLSIRKKVIKKALKVKVKKRRLRKGKRSKLLYGGFLSKN